MNQDLQRLCNRLGYQFQDEALLLLALTHRSASRRHNNERLEFLGDALLGRFISESLYRRFDHASEGQLTRMRASLVRGQTLAEVAAELRVGEALRLGSGEMKSGGHRRESILADAVEALIGAIYLEGGNSACQTVIDQWFASRMENLSPESMDKDAKTRLQEWLQARQFQVPDYVVTGITGQPPHQRFDISCHISLSETPFAGQGSSRRKAEQQSARKALAWIQEHKNDKG